MCEILKNTSIDDYESYIPLKPKQMSISFSFLTDKALITGNHETLILRDSR